MYEEVLFGSIERAYAICCCNIKRMTDYSYRVAWAEVVVTLTKSLRYARRNTTVGAINHTCYGAEGDVGTWSYQDTGHAFDTRDSEIGRDIIALVTNGVLEWRLITLDLKISRESVWETRG